ncbi:MAG: M43 family zinc metalloprotease [Bacteroidia bacterium]|nr:M43 family zinc metalloprotease [Bacteroidia bacterium]MDW8133971.1 M43 family zinc metalloprotease [Bacteroidia bacterium]
MPRVIILLCATLWAQLRPTCGTDEYQRELEARNPLIKHNREALEEILTEWAERSTPHLRTQTGCPESEYIVPVVVHIIHSGWGQPDSLPMDRVILQMEQLFNDFRKRPYTKGYSSGVDTRIEFSLATIAPNGTPHPGVTYHHYSSVGLSSATIYRSGSGANVSTLKNNVGWPRNKYLNIWVVGRICSSSNSCPPSGDILGFATLPDNISDVDEGVVVAAFVFGNTGGGQTTTHEIGHYLALYHTFHGGCAGMTNSNCNTSGDRVCDTPPTSQDNYGAARRQNTCGENITILGIDVPDLVRNYMDYLDDISMDIFTEGQRVRMRNALINATDRNTQWQATNLQATGTGPWGRIRANFALKGCEQPPCYVCPGQTLNFVSYSWGKPHQFEWQIRQGTSIIASSNAGPCATLTAPSTPGTYDVYLSVANQVNSDDTTYAGFLIVRDPSQAASFPFSEGFEGTTFPPTGWVRYNPDFATGNSNNIIWERYSSAGRGSFGASNATARIRNWSYMNRGQRDYLITPLISLPATAQDPVIEFDVYYRTYYWENTTTNPPNYGYLYGDTLAVYISEDCGSTWQRLFYEGGEGLDVTGSAAQIMGRNLTSTDQAVPPTGPNNAWQHKVIPIPSSYLGKNILIMFENITEMGNNLYLDSVQVRPDFSSYTSSLERAPTISLMPNPASAYTILRIKDGEGNLLAYRILSLTGQILRQDQLKINSSLVEYSIPLEGLATGLYIVEANLGEGRQWRFSLMKE